MNRIIAYFAEWRRRYKIEEAKRHAKQEAQTIQKSKKEEDFFEYNEKLMRQQRFQDDMDREAQQDQRLF